MFCYAYYIIISKEKIARKNAKKKEKELVKCQLTNIQYSKKTSYSYFTNHIHYISKKLTTKDQNPMNIGHDSQIPRIRARSTLPHSAQWEV